MGTIRFVQFIIFLVLVAVFIYLWHGLKKGLSIVKMIRIKKPKKDIQNSNKKTVSNAAFSVKIYLENFWEYCESNTMLQNLVR